MGGTHKKGLTIERINNDGDYTKDNCRWATRGEQNKNRRKRRAGKTIVFNGEEKTIREWANIMNIHSSTLYSRLYYGWSIKEALTKPVKK